MVHLKFLEKKVRISYGNFLLFPNNFESVYLKIGLFDRVKKLFKSNQPRYGVSQFNPECEKERSFGIDCVGKS